MGELLWQLVKLYGYARVRAYLDELAQQKPVGAGYPLQEAQRLRVELVSGVEDQGYELLERDDEVYVWDEPNTNFGQSGAEIDRAVRISRQT
jgi:hypothetical protein